MSHRLRRLLAAAGRFGTAAAGSLRGWRPLLGFWVSVLVVLAAGGATLHWLGPPPEHPVRGDALPRPRPPAGPTGTKTSEVAPVAAPPPARPGSAERPSPPDRPPPDARAAGGAGQAVGRANVAPGNVAPGNDDPANGPSRGRVLVVFRHSRSEGGAAVAQQLAVRIGLAAGQTATEAVADAPPRATIRFYSEADHALARRLGRELTQLGYAWQIENFSARPTPSSIQAVEVWLPER